MTKKRDTSKMLSDDDREILPYCCPIRAQKTEHILRTAHPPIADGWKDLQEGNL